MPDQAEGKRVRCSSCKHSFLANSEPEAEQPEHAPTPPRATSPKKAADTERPKTARKPLPVEDDADDKPKPSRQRMSAKEDDEERPKPTRKRVLDEEAEDERPRRARRRVDEDDNERPQNRKKASFPKGLLIGGGVGLLVLVTALYFAFSGSSKPAMDASVVGDFGQIDEQKLSDVEWNVPGDPAVEIGKITANLAIPMPIANAYVHLPSTVSPFVAIGNPRSGTDTCTIWDLTKNVSPGKIGASAKLSEPLRVSHDGKYLAGRRYDSDNPVVVYSFATGREAFNLRQGEKGHIGWYDFGESSDEMFVIAGVVPASLRKWKNGKEVASVAVPHYEKQSIAFSANRKYLSFATSSNILVYDLTECKLVGTRPIPLGETKALQRCKGMSFSPDGKELAAILHEHGKNELQIYAWDLAKGGDPIRSHFLPLDEKSPSAHSDIVPIQYTSDSNAWVIEERLLIERDTGMQLMRLQPNLAKQTMPRLRLFSDAILKETSEANPSLHTVAFDDGKYTATIQAVRGSADISPAEVAANRTGTKAIATTAEPMWSVKGNAAPANDKWMGNIPLLTAGKDALAIAVSTTNNLAGVVSLTETPTPFLRKALRWDRYDFAEKQHLGMIELVTHVKKPLVNGLLVDQSPSGSFLALRHPDDSKRLDVFAAKGKHPGRFVPYAAGIDWLGFVADDKLLTLGEGKITLWELPAFKALSETDAAYRTTATLSPDRKWLAVYYGLGYDIIDATTGERKGRVATGIPAPEDGKMPAPVAFSPDGKQLAATIPANNRQAVITWNLESGKRVDSFKTSAAPPTALQWCGPRLLMLNGRTLIDLETKIVVWHYSSLRRFAALPPDLRHWHTSVPKGAAGGLLHATRLPDGVAEKANAAIRDPDAVAIMKEGMTIAVEVRSNRGAGFDSDMTSRFTTALQQDGFQVETQAPLKLILTAHATDTGERMELSDFGSGNMTKKVINLKKITAKLEIVDAAAKTLWKSEQVHEKREGFRLFKAGEDPETVLQHDLWQLCTTWAIENPRPSVIFRKAPQTIVLPGYSPLTAE